MKACKSSPVLLTVILAWVRYGRLRKPFSPRARFLSACGFAVASLLSVPAHAELIKDPDDQFWRNLSQVFADETPDYDQIARRTPEYRQADEFDKGDVLADQVLKLKRIKTSFGSDWQVLFRAAIRLDDYDPERGGFPINLFEPGIYLDVGSGLRFSNASDYAVLPATPEEGREIRQKERASSSLPSGLLLAGDFRMDPGHRGGMLATLYRFDYVDGNDTVIASIESVPDTQGLDDDQVEALVQTTQAKILQLAGLPPIGSPWPLVRDALQLNYGYAASENRRYDDGKFRMVEGGIQEEDLSDASRFRVGFGNSGDMVSQIFAKQGFTALATTELGRIDTNATGRGLDCDTPHLADACGILIFEKQQGDWILTKAEGVLDLEETDHGRALETVLGHDVDAFLRSDLTVAYDRDWLAGKTSGLHFSGQYAPAARYILGEDMGGKPLYLRPTDHYLEGTPNFEVMLYAVDGAPERTPLIFTLAPRQRHVEHAAAVGSLSGKRIMSSDLKGLTAYELLEDPRFLPAIEETLHGTDLKAIQRATAVSSGSFEDRGAWFVHGGCRPHDCSDDFATVAISKEDGHLIVVRSHNGTSEVFGSPREVLPPVFERHGL